MTYYTPDQAGSGQFGICIECRLPPSDDGHDGCLGDLGETVMNACCGHGKESIAYVQYWDGRRTAGAVAVEEQFKLKIKAAGIKTKVKV